MLYVVRHGETDWNVRKRAQGHTDIPLNANGLGQAQVAADELKEVQFDAVFSSPLKRARETCEIVINANLYGGEIVFDKRIMERSFGVFEGKSTDEVKWPELWDIDADIAVERGERVSDVITRVYEFLNDIKEKYAGKNVLIVGHGGITSVIHYYFHGERMKFKNCEIRTYVI